MQRFLFAISVVAALAGCASGVSLDNVPVEDKKGVSATGAGSAAGAGQASQVGKAGVTGVALGKTGSGAAAASARIVYFDFDSFSIKPEYQALLESHARHLSSNKAQKVAVEGHADERGGREYNLALGQKRAEAVRKALVLLGVDDAQIDAISYGEEKPAASGTDETSMGLNRRAEISYR